MLLKTIEDAYIKHKKYLTAMACKMMVRKELADELVQDVFMSLVKDNVILIEATARGYMARRLLFIYGKYKAHYNLSSELHWDYVPFEQESDIDMERDLISKKNSNYVANKISRLSFYNA